MISLLQLDVTNFVATNAFPSHYRGS